MMIITSDTYNMCRLIKSSLLVSADCTSHDGIDQFTSIQYSITITLHGLSIDIYGWVSLQLLEYKTMCYGHWHCHHNKITVQTYPLKGN